MAISLEEFAKEFFQDILSEGDVQKELAETVFFEKFCASLVEVGELDAAHHAHYQGQPNSGVRVDGYGGEPDDAGILNIIVIDFERSNEIKRITQAEMQACFHGLHAFLQKSLEPEWKNALEETAPGFGLADLIFQRWGAITKVRMFLLTNRDLGDRVDGKEAGEIDGRTVTYSVWDIKRLHHLLDAKQGQEAIEIDLEKDFEGSLPLLPAHFPSTEHESYLVVMPGSVLAAIYDRWGARLLEQNVRVFLQARGNVNKGIQRTLENAPSMFFAYNNGITATAEEVHTEKKNGQLVLTGLKNFQIVNGGQTTASIHLAMRNGMDLSEIFVQMKLSVIQPEKAEEVVPKISEYANTQNRVNAADFFTNHPFHVRMEEFSRRLFVPSSDGKFQETRWFYERARGQYSDARAQKTSTERRKFDLVHPRSQLFNKTDLAKFLNVWECKPHIVSLGAQKNFADFAVGIGKTWAKDDKSFNENYFMDAISKAIVFKKTEKLVSEQPWYEGGYRANIVAYAISKLAYEAEGLEQSVNFQAIWGRQSLPDSMVEALEKVAKCAHGVLIDTPKTMKNVTEWAKKQACWERVKRANCRLPEAFVDSLISPEQVQTRAKAGKKDQQILDGIAAQTHVFQAGDAFWREVLEWGVSRDLLSHKEHGLLKAGSLSSRKLPSEKQSVLIMDIFSRLRDEGLDKELPS